MNTLFKILFVTRLPIFLAVILYLTIFAPSLLADNNLSSRTKTVVVSPVSFSYDDTITITVHGLPVDYTLPPDSVYLGDTLVRIPGHSGDLDARPTSDFNGTLSFSTTLPDNLQIGSQYLAVNITNIFEAQTAVTVRPISLRVSSTTVVPYQDVWVMGRGFKARPGSNVLTYTIDENEVISPTSSLVLDPNYYIGLYPKYTSFNLNGVIKWNYTHGSNLYIVYTARKSVSGERFQKLGNFFQYNTDGRWVETLRDQSIMIKIDYWFEK